MFKKIKVSIIVTNYNYSKFIKRCLNSCFNQTFDKNFYEVIFVDDFSSDNSLDVAKKFLNKKNFKIIENDKNLGVAGSANEAIKKCKGQYFVRVDSDDYISKNLLEILALYLDKNPNQFGIACDYTYVGTGYKKYKIESSKNFPISCGIMYRRKLFLKFGMYNIEFRHREEEELRARLGNKYKVGNLKLSLYRYRRHKNNKTLQKKNMSFFERKLKNENHIEYPINYELENKNKINLSKNIIAIIPARIGSKRLKEKNIFLVKKKPMIYWAIKAAKNSKLIKHVFVSSESEKIKKIVEKYNVGIIDRPKILSNPKVFKIDVIKHSINYLIKKKYKPTLVISLQANSPEITSQHIDKCINHLLKFDLNEVISVNKNNVQNAAIRVMKLDTLYQKTLSTKIGFCYCQLKDVHYKKDLKNLKIYGK